MPSENLLIERGVKRRRSSRRPRGLRIYRARSGFGGAPFALSGSRWSIILYLPPYGLTGWGNLHTGHGVVLRALTLHLPTNLPPPLHSEVIA